MTWGERVCCLFALPSRLRSAIQIAIQTIQFNDLYYVWLVAVFSAYSREDEE